MLVLCITVGIVFVLWIGYSGWSAPLMKENEDGSWTTLQPQKKFSDLFKKQTPTKKEDEGYSKNDFQKLAGIKPHNKESAPFNPVNNILNQRIVEELLKAVKNNEFPKPDESINVKTTKITTIDSNFGDSDPLAQIPLSRVSKEGKQKMADIAREDIRINTEAVTNEIIAKGLYTPLDDMGSVGTKPKTQTDYAREHTPSVSKKRKPKTAKENEAEFELGGSE
jgi:hypothetical protein